jgi:hypothetical protein
MKLRSMVLIWVLTALTLLACAEIGAASSARAGADEEQKHVLGPYRSQELATAAARRLGERGWRARVSRRGPWYVQVKWPHASQGSARPAQGRITPASAVSDGGKKEQKVKLEACEVSDLVDSDWQINACRVRQWAQPAGVTRAAKQQTGKTRLH